MDNLLNMFSKKNNLHPNEVVEYEDCVICYISQKCIDDNEKEHRLGGNRCYTLKYYINDNNLNFDKIAESNKKIHYVFENIVFEGSPCISSKNGSLSFVNCTFKNGCVIYCNSLVVMKGNNYKGGHQQRKIECHSPKIVFSDNKFEKDWVKCWFNVDLIANEKVLFYHTKMNEEKKDCLLNLNITTPSLIIKDSKISCNEAYINAKNIEFDNSKILAINGIMMDNEECLGNININAPIIIYNNADIINKDRNVEIVNTSLLELQRLKLSVLDLLKKFAEEKAKAINSNCENNNLSKVKNRCL